MVKAATEFPGATTKMSIFSAKLFSGSKLQRAIPLLMALYYVAPLLLPVIIILSIMTR